MEEISKRKELGKPSLTNLFGRNFLKVVA